MFVDIRMPEIGVDEAEVTDILVQVGEKVSLEQPLIMIEGEKVSMELPSPDSGVVKEIKISKGDILKKDMLIMVLKSHAKKEEESTLSNDKIYQYHQPLKVRDDHPEYTKQSTIGDEKNDIEKNQFLHATPLVRRLSRKFNVDLKNIKGSGKKCRILPEDVFQYVKEAVNRFNLSFYNNDNNKSSSESNMSESLVIEKKIEEFKILKMNHIQKNSCKNLVETWKKVPHVTIFGEVDVEELNSFRKLYRRKIKEEDKSSKITMLPFFLKAVSKIMKEFPIFNSEISNNLGEIILKKDINIGIAVNTDFGLLVPVIKNVDRMDIFEISKVIGDMSEQARSGRLFPKDMQKGGFTISNLGGLGPTNGFTPIVNSPEVAILGLSRSFMKPIWDGSKFLAKLTMPVSLSFDHRIINGAEGVKFIERISFLIQDLRNLLM